MSTHQNLLRSLRPQYVPRNLCGGIVAEDKFCGNYSHSWCVHETGRARDSAAARSESVGVSVKPIKLGIQHRYTAAQPHRGTGGRGPRRTFAPFLRYQGSPSRSARWGEERLRLMSSFGARAKVSDEPEVATMPAGGRTGSRPAPGSQQNATNPRLARPKGGLILPLAAGRILSFSAGHGILPLSLSQKEALQ